MADERSRPPYHQASPIPEPYAWPRLLDKDGDALIVSVQRWHLEFPIGA